MLRTVGGKIGIALVAAVPISTILLYFGGVIPNLITFIEAILLVVFPAMITAGAVLIYRDWQIPDTWISDIKGEIEACRDELDSDEYHLAPIPMNAWKDESEEEKRKTLKVRYQKVKEFYDELISRNERIRGLTMMQKTDVKAVNESTRHKARLALNALK